MRLVHLAFIDVEIPVLQSIGKIVVMRILVSRFHGIKSAISPEVNTGTADGGPTSEAVPTGNGVNAATMAACSPPMLMPPTTNGPYPASMK